MENKKIIIGSRGSKLALLYAEKAKKSIITNNKELSEESLEIKIIKTDGDINQNQRLSEIGGKGLFSKKIESELLNKNIDIAVHALKDLPSIETTWTEEYPSLSKVLIFDTIHSSTLRTVTGITFPFSLKYELFPILVAIKPVLFFISKSLYQLLHQLINQVSLVHQLFVELDQ